MGGIPRGHNHAGQGAVEREASSFLGPGIIHTGVLAGVCVGEHELSPRRSHCDSEFVTVTEVCLHNPLRVWGPEVNQVGCRRLAHREVATRREFGEAGIHVDHAEERGGEKWTLPGWQPFSWHEGPCFHVWLMQHKIESLLQAGEVTESQELNLS